MTYSGIFLVTLVVHLIVALQMKMLHISTDEMGVLASAAFLTGENWSGLIQNISYYGYGQSLLYIPIYLLTDDPVLRYKLMGVENSILLSIIPLIVYYILIKYLNIDRKTSVVLSMCIGLFSTYTSFTKWLWYETTLSVLPWVFLIITLFLASNENKIQKTVFSIIYAALLIYSYSVHGRALGIIAVALILIIGYHVVCKCSLVNYIAFSCSFLLSSAGYLSLKEYLVNNLWLAEGKTLNNTSSSILPRLANIFSLENLPGNLCGVLGQIYSAAMSTYGLLILFAIIMCILFVKQKSCQLSKNEYIIFVFSALLFLGALAISVTFLSGTFKNPSSRGDYPIYIRYFSHTLGFIVFSCLVLLTKRSELITHTTRWATLLIVILISLATTIFVAPMVNEKNSIANIPLMNILPFIGDNPVDFITQVDFGRLSLVVLLVCVLFLFFTYRKGVITSSIILLIAFLYVYGYNATQMILPNNTKDYEKVGTIQEILGEIDFEKYGMPIYYHDPDQKKPWSDSMLQFSLPKAKVYNIVTAEPVEENSIIVSTTDIGLDHRYNNCYRMIDDNLNTEMDFIWICGDELNTLLCNEYSFETKNSCGETKSYQLDFSTQVGIKTDNCIHSTGEQGFLIYGPYISLRAGEYQINIKGEYESGTFTNDSYFDIVYGGGKKQVSKYVNLQQFTNGNTFNIDITFTLEDDVSNCEFRLYVNEGVICSIEDITLSSK